MDYPLDSDQLKTWTMFLRAHASLMRRMETDLQRANGISLVWMDALVQLSLEEGRRMTHTRLSERLLVNITPGGVTRLVDRMEKAGLVERVRSAQDRRESYVVMTDKGEEMRRAAYPSLYRHVVDLFVHHLDEENLPVVKAFFARVLGEDRPA